MDALKEHDRVYTPSGRIAEVLGFLGGFVRVRFIDDSEDFSIAPKYLKPVVPAGGPRR